MTRIITDDDEAEAIDHDGVQHTTELAKLYLIDGEKVWIPKSMIVDEDEDEGLVLVKGWFARKEGLV